MADPTPYTPGYDFTATDKGPELNVELQNIGTAVSSTQTALADIRRSDGALQNGIVTADSVAPDVISVFSPSVNARLDEAAASAESAAGSASAAASSEAVAVASAASAGAARDAAVAAKIAAEAAENSLLEWAGPWASGVAYAPSDLAQIDGSTYVCVVAHTSSAFATDLGLGVWQLFAAKGGTGAGSGDMLAANNLSELPSKSTARFNLGLGDLAVDDLADYTKSTATWLAGTDGTPGMVSPSDLVTVANARADAEMDATFGARYDAKFDARFGVVGAAPVFLPRAWGVFEYASGVSVLGSANIASITRSSAGVYNVTFSTAMPDTAYAVMVTTSGGALSGTTSLRVGAISLVRNVSTTGFTLMFQRVEGSDNLDDTRRVNFIVIR